MLYPQNGDRIVTVTLCIYWVKFTPSGAPVQKKCGAPNIWIPRNPPPVTIDSVVSLYTARTDPDTDSEPLPVQCGPDRDWSTFVDWPQSASQYEQHCCHHLLTKSSPPGSMAGYIWCCCFLFLIVLIQTSCSNVYWANLCQICRVGRTHAALDDQTEISFLIPQGTLP